jgi:5-dehydro-2-deoxygluconokinase
VTAGLPNRTAFAAGRAHDIVCLGRLAVDLYAQQIGARLEDATSFAKYLGGSSANIAFGCARLGLRSAMLSRVGDDHMGRFLTETLAREGCDVSQVARDPDRLTALVMLGVKDRHSFPLLFYRENCADMAIAPDDVSEAFIGDSRALLITGTHLSTPAMLAVSLRALGYAARHDVRRVLDIDFRPVLWGLSGRADGETRFVPDRDVTDHLQAVLPHFDLVVGTEEEFMIAGGGADIVASLRAVRAVTAATLVVKRGPLGCAVIDAAVPASLDDAFNYRGVQVEVLNVLGAGDAFLSGFLKGWLDGAGYEQCCRLANACGALVVARHGCAPAMPTPAELDYFLAHAGNLRRPGQDAALTRLHRVSAARVEWPELCVFAFDHRNQFFELARLAGADPARIERLKLLLVRALGQSETACGLAGKTGVLIDDTYGAEALHAATGRGWWVGRPVELPGSNPLQFEHGRSVGSVLVSWPREHVAKCLVQLHPDDDIENRLEQEAQVKSLYDALPVSGHELLLEVIPPANLPRAEDTVLRAMKRLYNIGVFPDWWKLEPMSVAQWRAVDALIAERDPYCRGVVLLGLNASPERLASAFSQAASSKSCRGFMVGRTIFQEPSRRWLAGDTDDAGLVDETRAGFEALVAMWRAARVQARVASGVAA